MSKNRVIIVEDDAPLRQVLSEWLAEEYEVTEFESAKAFLKGLHKFTYEIPTCIVLDFQMPEMNGVELQTKLKSMNIACPIIFISGNAQHTDIIDAWRGGANDFLLKPFSGSQISQLLKTTFTKFANDKFDLVPLKTNDVLIQIPISQREAEVLLLLGEGYRQSEVAEALDITLRTVKMHRSNLKNKLGLNTLSELTRYYNEYKLSIEKVAKS